MDDETLLIQCDSIISLIRYREINGLSRTSIQDIDDLLTTLRPRTDEIIRIRREQQNNAR